MKDLYGSFFYSKKWLVQRFCPGLSIMRSLHDAISHKRLYACIIIIYYCLKNWQQRVTFSEPGSKIGSFPGFSSSNFASIDISCILKNFIFLYIFFIFVSGGGQINSKKSNCNRFSRNPSAYVIFSLGGSGLSDSKPKKTPTIDMMIR